MQIRMDKIRSAWRSPRSWGFFAALTAYFALARAFVSGDKGVQFAGFPLPQCPLKAFTGVPCPFCGLTTGTAWAGRGAWDEAWSCNILSPVLMSFAILLAVYTVVFRFALGRELNVDVSGGLRHWPWIAFASLSAVSWIVNLLRK